MLEQFPRNSLASSPFPKLDMNGLKSVAWSLVVALAYFFIAGLSLYFAFENTSISPIWPPAGIALVAVLFLGYPVAAGVFVGALASNFFTLDFTSFPNGPVMIASFLTATGNTLEALIGAYLIRRFLEGDYIFQNIKNTLVFVVFGAFLSAAVSSFIGVSGMLAVINDWSLYWSALFTWWLGDVTGTVLIAPLFLSWEKRDRAQWNVGRIGETTLVLLLLCLVSITIYVWNNPFKFLVFPVLLWIVVRFDLLTTSFSVAIMSAVAVYGISGTTGRQTGVSVQESLFLIQSYLGVIAITALFLSVVVSERKHSIETARAEKIFTDTIIDSIPGAFYLLDRQGRLVRWNHFLEELNDTPSEALKGMHILNNIHEDDRKHISDKIAEAFEKGEAIAEGRIRTKHGILYFIFTGKRIDTGEFPYLVGTGFEITARKKAEMELEEHQRTLEAKVAERTLELTELNTILASEIEERRSIEKTLLDSEAKYRDLVEGANSVILRWDKDGRIVFINRFAQEFFGYLEDEILGKNIVGTIVPAIESTGRSLFLLANSIHENPAAYMLNENENMKKNGERVWVAWTNRAIMDKNGRIVEILSVGNDITRRKRAEDRLKITLDELAAAKNRAEAADKLKSAFLATMSHELRTPLNSIIGFTGIILAGYVGPLNDEQAKQLGMVQNSANHLLSLINDVLDISKIEADQLKVSFEPFSLRALIDKVAQSSHPALTKKGLALSIHIDEKIDMLVSDRQRVEQILLNLLSNAIKFTNQGGINISCEHKNSLIQIDVTDTGIGIQEKDLDKLFKAFQQVDTGTTRKFEGTGLGLYICQKLLDLLGGKVWVTSTWGSGSTFSFSLPIEREPS